MEPGPTSGMASSSSVEVRRQEHGVAPVHAEQVQALSPKPEHTSVADDDPKALMASRGACAVSTAPRDPVHVWGQLQVKAGVHAAQRQLLPCLVLAAASSGISAMMLSRMASLRAASCGEFSNADYHIGAFNREQGGRHSSLMHVRLNCEQLRTLETSLGTSIDSQ